MKILLTNDDGIDAEGLRLLAAWAKTLGEVTVVAPKSEQSCKSHAIFLGKAYEIRQVPFMEGVSAYAMDSTPADCVRFGFAGLAARYDLVLSGINHGVNLGEDIVYSGTVGAIFEGAKQGACGVAFSALPSDFQGAAKQLDRAYAYLTERKLFEENRLYNINIPARSRGIKMTCQGSRYYDDYFERLEEGLYRQVGTLRRDDFPNDTDRDTVAFQAGYITVTPLMETRTNAAVFEKYRTK